MKKILLATNTQALYSVISKFNGYSVFSDTIGYKSEIINGCIKYEPDILVVTDNLIGEGVLLSVLIKLKRERPNIRVVYLAPPLDLKNKQQVNNLGMYVVAGITDILHEKQLTSSMILNLLDNPRTMEQMSYLLRDLNGDASEKEDDMEIIDEFEEEVEDEMEKGYKKVYIISSIKPGTGKSFISTNIATMIAKHGRKPDGSPLRVALIEGDLQNLSIGTLLQIEDDKYNLKTCMEQILTIVDEHGNLTDDTAKIEEVNKFIKKSFKPYYHAKNLEALVGSQFTIEQTSMIHSYCHTYLVETILNDYDVIILDSNSSFQHVTTYPLLRLSHTAYYILNLDFNNVRNNARYKETLYKLGFYDKVKYILNEDIEGSYAEETEPEVLTFNANHLKESGFDVIARVPLLPKTVFLNRLYEGKPIALDTSDHTIKARYEIAKIASDICELDNMELLESEMERLNGKDRKKRFGFF